MRMASKVLVALSVVALVTVSASAQEPKQGRRGGQPGGGFGGRGMMGGGGLAMYLGNPGVQEELKITDDQKKTIQEKQGEMREKMQDTFAKLREASPEERQEMMKKVSAESTKMVKGVLKPEQYTRLQQIYWQNNVLTALTTDEDAEKKLNLTADQKEKLKGINEEMQKDRRELMQEAQGGGGFQAIQPKMAALTKETNTKAAGVLTDAQKKTWKEMVGAPYEVKMQAPRRRDT
jgi:Spy/CpxP family protein refolding chaperone